MINLQKLHNELEKAGVQISGCDCNGVVFDMLGNQIQSRPDVAAVLAAHDPTETPELFISFGLPLIAPKITVSEIIVQSPKPKERAADALAHLIALAKSKDKPLAEIILNLVVYIDDLEKRVKKKNI